MKTKYNVLLYIIIGIQILFVFGYILSGLPLHRSLTMLAWYIADMIMTVFVSWIYADYKGWFQ